MKDGLAIRTATPADAGELLEIYRPFVEGTAVSFEEVAPTPEQFAGRIAKALEQWQWLVAVEGGRCVGYAYGTVHRERPAYRYSAEVSAYVHPDHHRKGVGRELYLCLFEDLAARGYCDAFAGVALPNEGSVALHLGVGFEPVGTFRRIGRKFGRWHDVAWFQRRLREDPPAG